MYIPFPGRFFSSHSVTEGQPDKICDQIADKVLDRILDADPRARVSCNVCISGQLVLLMGEITSKTQPPYEDVVRETMRSIGYRNRDEGFDPEDCIVVTAFHRQSLDIDVGVNKGGAGDTCTVVGFACSDTSEFMPAPLFFAHKLCMKLAEARKTGIIPYLRPDGKAQVTFEYESGYPVRIDSVTLLAQHKHGVQIERLQRDLKSNIIEAVLPKKFIDENTKVYINPTGSFVSGGPAVDSGLTGRKVLVDMYGGMERGGGGSMSGKDPSKIHRVGAYGARNVAKSLVAAGLSRWLEVRITYAIGVSKPLDVDVTTYGSSQMKEEELVRIVSNEFDLSPASMVDRFSLRKPNYSAVACYGHFGRTDIDLPWEHVVRLR